MKKLITLLILSTAGAVACAQNLRSSPPDDCSADNALMTASMDALNRQVATGPAMAKALHQMENLADKYHNTGKPGQPIGELMSKSDSVEFAKLESQIRTMRLYELAESRLERDMNLLLELHAMALKDRDVGIDMGHINQLMHDNHAESGIRRGMNRELIVYTYLYTLRESFKNDDSAAFNATAEPTNKCPAGVALGSESDLVFASWQHQVTSSPLMQELSALRAKYKVPDGVAITSAKLNGPDVQHAAFLDGQARAMLRPANYFSEMNGLRFFLEAANLEYTWQRENILQQGGSADTAEFHKLDAARYAKLTPTMQRAINIWQHIDEILPSQAMLDAEQVLKTLGESGAK